MQERAIYISSVDRQKIGKKFNPVLKLDPSMRHEIAMDRTSMTYSWYNFRAQYKNKKIKYSNDGVNSMHTINFISGMHSYSDINDYIHKHIVVKKMRQSAQNFKSKFLKVKILC